jgi:hypothetical protein
MAEETSLDFFLALMAQRATYSHSSIHGLPCQIIKLLQPRHVHGNGETGLYRQHSLLVIPNEVYPVRFFLFKKPLFPSILFLNIKQA